jgi:hypothetical protein
MSPHIPHAQPFSAPLARPFLRRRPAPLDPLCLIAARRFGLERPVWGLPQYHVPMRARLVWARHAATSRTADRFNRQYSPEDS